MESRSDQRAPRRRGQPARISAWPSLPPEAWLWAPPASPPFPLDRPNWRLLARASTALYFGVRALGLAPGDELIIPDYNHGSEIDALERAGVVPRFHRSTLALEPPEEELDELVGSRTRGLYLIHHNGYPQAVKQWRRWCDDRGLLLIEDAAEAWLAQQDGAPVGSSADLAYFGAHNTYGPRVGTLLVSRSPPAPPGLSHAPCLERVPRRRNRWLAHLLLERLVAQNAAAARRSNYRVLLRELAVDVPEPFGLLPDGASPLYFPLRSRQKSRLLSRLADSSIEALDVWPGLQRSVPALPGSAAAERRATTVGLPVHQELGVAELERIVDAAAPRPRARPELRLEPVTDIESLGGEWDALAERAGNLFATREWMSTWWRHYGNELEWRVTACRNLAGELVGILPLCVSSRPPVRVLRFLGHGPGDRLGPICAAADVASVAKALSRHLARTRTTWDILLAERLPADERWGALVRGTHLRFEASPFLRVRWDGFEAFLASRSKNFRDQVRGRERRLHRDHRLEYRLSDDPDRMQQDLSVLFGLHANRWGDGSQAFDERRQAFHRDFAAEALERGWLRLWLMELDGRPVAAWYGFRFAGAEWYYQGGRDLAHDRAAVGFVLLSHTVRVAIEDGICEYRLLRGNEEFKSRFANADDGLESFVLGQRPKGQAAAAGAAMASALPPAARRALVNLTG